MLNVDSSSSIEELRRELQELRQKFSAQKFVVLVMFAICLFSSLLVLFAYPLYSNDKNEEVADVLKVRGIIVVDERGTPRVQIGAPLPDPMMMGKRINRNSTAHGILLLDAEGNERSGYVTFDESGVVMLTMDEVGRKVGHFGALPAGGVQFQLKDQFKNTVSISTFKEKPFIKLSHDSQSVTFTPETKGGSDDQ